MALGTDQKVTASHLDRKAYLYVRQSSPKQVLENTESTERQYALRERAVALGWPEAQIEVIDIDLGESASRGAADRQGFERLVAETGMGRAGIVMGLEVSRLARTSSAWHRLMEICALTDTLVLDQDGVYDTTNINDRLVLGLKAAMSEVEIYTICQRLQGGALNKAARGELRVPLPVGFLYDEQGQVVMDPDKEVREAIEVFFRTFRRVNSAYQTARFFSENKLKFPKRLRCGPNKGMLVWTELTTGRVSQVLHNPRYAGAYAYGRSKCRIGVKGTRITRELPPAQWHTLIKDAHQGYISWSDYEKNLAYLARNHREAGERGPAREGSALLQGLAVCGVCGRHMTVRYHKRRDGTHADYVCRGPDFHLGVSACQALPGKSIDAAVEALLLEVVSPVTLEASLAVQHQVQQRFEEADKLRLRQVERAQYEADMAKRRYLKVDPDNRLVADQLEAEWNGKLQALREAEGEYQVQRERDRLVIDGEQRRKILSLANDLPNLWRNPRTPQRERKRMAQLLIEDVTLVKNDPVKVEVRFQGGATRSLTVPRARPAYELCATDSRVVSEIDRLLDDYTYREIAERLNQRGLKSGGGKSFDAQRVNVIRRAYGLRDRRARLRGRGLLTVEEVARKLGTTPRMVKVRRGQGTLAVGTHKLSDKGDYMYEDPDAGFGGDEGVEDGE